MGLVPKGETPDALWFGIGVHEAFSQWYKKGKRRGRHPADFFEEWAGDEFREMRVSGEDWDELPKYEDAVDLGINLLNGYVDQYGKDPSWDVIATEHPFHTRVLRNGEPVAYFDSRWDGVYRDLGDGKLYLMEHKTAGQIFTAYLEMDPQAGAYWAVATGVLRAQKVLGPRERIEGVTYNFLRKAMGDDRPRNDGGAYLNQDGSVSKRQPAPRFVRHTVYREQAELRAEMNHLADEVEVMGALKAGTLPILKNRTRDCPFCPFWDMCKLHEYGDDRWRELLTEYDQRNPYEDNCKSASG